MTYLLMTLLLVLVLLGLERLFRLGRRGRIVLGVVFSLWALVDAGRSVLSNPDHPFVIGTLSFCDSVIVLGLWFWISTWLREADEQRKQSQRAH